MAREMKCTGIEWLGEIPEPWATPKLLNVLREKICDGPHETPNYTEEGIPFVSIDSLNESKDINFSVVKRFISQEDYELYSKKTRIEEGDILFSKAATIGKTAIVGKEVFMVWSPLAVIKRDKDKVNNDYLYYLLNCDHLIRHIALSGSMNTQINVGMRELEQARIPLPPKSEQQAIAGFLDTECDRIDAVLDQTRVSIEEYKKLKQAVIIQAVTKGIRSGREMKDSGVEWIGAIPKEWQIHQIKNDFSVVSGATPKSEVKENWDGDIVWITPADYKTSDRFVYKGKRNISEVGYASCGTTLVPKGSIVFSKRAPIGTVAITGSELCTNQGCLSCVPKKDSHISYYYYVMAAFTEQFNFLGTGTTFKEISYDNFGSFRTPHPCYSEQHEIAKYLDDETGKIDILIKNKESLLIELEAYKKNLIYEYVTGKKEVQ